MKRILLACCSLFAALAFLLHVTRIPDAHATWISPGSGASSTNTGRRVVKFSFTAPGDTTYSAVDAGFAVALFGAGSTTGGSNFPGSVIRPGLFHSASALNATRGATSSTKLTETDWNPILTTTVVFSSAGTSHGSWVGMDDNVSTGSCTLGGGAVWTQVFTAGSGTCTAVAPQFAGIIYDTRGVSSGKAMCCAASGGNWTCANITASAAANITYAVRIALSSTSGLACTLTNVIAPGTNDGTANVLTNNPGTAAALRLTSGMQAFTAAASSISVGGVQIDNPY